VNPFEKNYCDKKKSHVLPTDAIAKIKNCNDLTKIKLQEWLILNNASHLFPLKLETTVLISVVSEAWPTCSPKKSDQHRIKILCTTN